MKSLFRSLAAGLIAAFALAPHHAAATPVDVRLSLLVDVSGSVDATEFALQRQGYVDAFRSQAIKDLITNTAGGTRQGAIAVNFIYWSGAAQQHVGVDWTLINSAAASDSFADSVLAANRPNWGGNSLTAPGSAINFAVTQYNTTLGKSYTGGAAVIDVSGDGEQNNGVDTAGARNNALASGGIDRINGIAITTDVPGLLNWYMANIVGGTDSFGIAATGFDTFGKAVQQKLYYEIAGEVPPIPLPAPVFLLIGGLLGMGLIARRRPAA